MIPCVNRRLTQITAALLVVAGAIPVRMASAGEDVVQNTSHAVGVGTAGTASRVTSAFGDVSGDSVTGDSCHGYFMGTSDGSPTVTTDAGPDKSAVNPGQRVIVTVSWSPADIGRSEPAKVTNCVEIGGTVSSSLSEEVKSGISGTSQDFSFDVPAQAGTELCDRGAVNGAGGSTGKTPILCYEIGPSAVLPETGFPVLLPVGGALAIGLAALVITRRRHPKTPQ